MLLNFTGAQHDLQTTPQHHELWITAEHSERNIILPVIDHREL